jgi:WD40 repeat protein
MNSIPLPSRIRRGMVAAGCAAAALALSPAPASADSIVYVKDGNVWLASGSGANQYQVTTDGTAEHPYRSPSQADDGTIAAGHGDEIVRMKQNGKVLNRLDPPTLMNSVSHPMDGVPVDVAISPDGTKVAYTFSGYECPIGASCGARTATGIIPSDRFAASATTTSYFHSPSWVTNSRILNSGGYGSHINLQDLGTEAFNWLTDQETDLGDAEVTRAGDKFAAVRGYGSSTHIIWERVNGNVQSGPKPADLPEGICYTNEQPGFDQPTWSPDGKQLAWAEPDGIWVHRDAEACTTPSPLLLLPGGSEPDWGPADVNPGPRETTGGGGTTSGSGGGGTTGGGGGTTGGGAPLGFTLKSAKGKLRVTGRVVKVKVGCACSYSAKLTLKGRTIARKRGSLRKAGTTVTIKLSAKQARAVRKLGRGSKALRLVVTASSGGASGTRSLTVAPR